MLTFILLTLVILFAAYEAVAHFVFHNVGMETLSHLWLRMEKGKWGLALRLVTPALLIALALHLEGVF